MRPLFKRSVPITPQRLREAIGAALAAPNASVDGRVLRRHVELTVCQRERHFWSPHLSLDLFEDGEATVLRGRYAPHPHIWTFIMAVYGVLILLATAASVYGASQWTLGWTPWAFWLLVPCAVGVALTWFASAVGQKLADPQMHALQAFLDDCVREASESSASEAGHSRPT